MRSRAIIAWRVATAIGWLALLCSLVGLHTWSFELGRLGIAVGPTGSIILALRRMALPVVEVFEAGRAVGRRESSAPERPHLRVVDGD